jgi:hypothetical protein
MHLRPSATKGKGLLKDVLQRRALHSTSWQAATAWRPPSWWLRTSSGPFELCKHPMPQISVLWGIQGLTVISILSRAPTLAQTQTVHLGATPISSKPTVQIVHVRHATSASTLTLASASLSLELMTRMCSSAFRSALRARKSSIVFVANAKSATIVQEKICCRSAMLVATRVSALPSATHSSSSSTANNVTARSVPSVKKIRHATRQVLRT